MNSRERGMTLVEVLVAIGILAVLIFASVSLTTSTLQMTRSNMDRQFATEKAISILEELKAVAQNASSSNGSIVVLDQYDDGTTPKPVLTIQTGALPGDPVSGNVPISSSNWLYSRLVSVIRIGGQPSAGVRLVRVAVYKNDPNGGQHLLAEVSSVVRTLATVMPQSQVYDVYMIDMENVPGWWVFTAQLGGFVNNAINDLEARNPGLVIRQHWITKLAYGRDEEYRPYLNRVNDSTADVPGVYFYPGTLPPYNSAACPPPAPSTSSGCLNPANLSAYYPPRGFKAHINVDGVDTNGYNSTNNLFPYALADQYNHAMRYYDEMALWTARYNAGEETDLTYRLLLDQMIMNPSRYANAILINLHGELFPFPPIRDYSDPAKAPDQTFPTNLQNIRVVTHPENLEYDTNTNINFRVYSYEAPNNSTSYNFMPVPITVLIKGIDLTSMPGTLTVRAIEGGPGLGMTTQSGGQYYANVNALASPTNPSNQMYATAAAVTGPSGTDTLITLYNSPLRAPYCTGGSCGSSSYNGQGLKSNYYLYNMQYIPAPMENFASTSGYVTAFTTDLTSTATTPGPKNTARWVIGINAANLNTILTSAGYPINNALTVETRIGAPPIGSPPTTGVVDGGLPASQVWPPALSMTTNQFPPLQPTPGQPGTPATRNEPPNLSRTYVWRGTQLWLFGDGTDANPPHLPMTERFQFIGDPRHCPYADLKRPYVTGTFQGSGWTNESYLGMGYNRYFDNFYNSSGNFVTTWPGWTYTVGGTQYGVQNSAGSGNDGYQTGGSGNGSIEIDVQRAFQILRTALTASRTIYTTMTGFSYYYIGIGGEVGYDASNQFPNSIPVSTMPFTGSSGTTTDQSIITPGGVQYVRAVGSGSSNYWWSMNWLGELYPDSMYNSNYAETAANVVANGPGGNLPTGTSANSFQRVLRGSINPTNSANFTLPAGTTFDSSMNSVRRTNVMGSTNMFWTGTATSTFHHIFSDNNTASLCSGGAGCPSGWSNGTDIASATTGYNYPILNPIPDFRPFNININNTGYNPQSFLSSVYGTPFVSKQEALYYWQNAAGAPGSALESLRDTVVPPGATAPSNKPAFIVVNGLSPAGSAGQQFIARWSFLSLIYSFFQAGLYTDSTSCTGCPFRVPQLPRVSITYPNISTDLASPSSVNIQWSVSWFRWDGQPYTPAYPSGFTESTPVSYQVMYSPDNGVTWHWCDTSIPGNPSLGVPNPAALISATNYNWSTPASSFPMGNYTIRVEAYRNNIAQHYAYHEFRAFIRR